MSAWPQAVWIIREIQKQFNLNERVLFLENRYYIFASPSSTLDSKGRKQPALPQEYDDVHFSDDSMWFIGQNVVANGEMTRNITGISLYHVEHDSQTGEIIDQGWSDPLNFTIDGSTIVFTPDDTTFFGDITDVGVALNFLASKMTQMGAFTQNQYNIPENGWQPSGGAYQYIMQSNEYDNYDFGENPTISLGNTYTAEDIKNFNFIDYVNVNTTNRTYTFHAISKPTNQLVLKISKY